VRLRRPGDFLYRADLRSSSRAVRDHRIGPGIGSGSATAIGLSIIAVISLFLRVRSVAEPMGAIGSRLLVGLISSHHATRQLRTPGQSAGRVLCCVTTASLCSSF